MGAVRNGALFSYEMGILGVAGTVVGKGRACSVSLSRVDLVRPRRPKDFVFGFLGIANPEASCSPAEESEISERDEKGKLGGWKSGSDAGVSEPIS